MNHQHLHHQQQTFVSAHPVQDDSPALPGYCDVYYQVNQSSRLTPLQAQQHLPRHQQVASDVSHRHNQQPQFVGAFGPITTMAHDHHQQNGLMTDDFGNHLNNDYQTTSVTSKHPIMYEQHPVASTDAAIYDYNNQLYLHQQPQTSVSNGLSNAQTLTYHQSHNQIQEHQAPVAFIAEPSIVDNNFNSPQQIQYVSTTNSTGQINNIITTNHYVPAATANRQIPQQNHQIHNHHPATLHQHHHLQQQQHYTNHQHHYQAQHHFDRATNGHLATNNISNHQHINGGVLAHQNGTEYIQHYTMQQTMIPDETTSDQYNNNSLEPARQVFYQTSPTLVASAGATSTASPITIAAQPATTSLVSLKQTIPQPQAVLVNGANTIRGQPQIITNGATLPDSASLVGQNAFLDEDDQLFGQQEPVVVTTASETTLTKNGIAFASSRVAGQSPILKSSYDGLSSSMMQSRANPYAGNEDQLMATTTTTAATGQQTQNTIQQQQQPRQQPPQELMPSRGCGNLTQDRMDFICEKLIGDMDHFGICVIDNFLGSINGELILKEVQELYSSGQYTKGRLVNNKLGKVDCNGKTAESNGTAGATNGQSGGDSSSTSSSPSFGPATTPSPASAATLSNAATSTTATPNTVASPKTTTATTSQATPTTANRAQLDASGAIRSDRVIWIDGCEDGCSEINNLIQTLCSVVTNSSRLSLYSNNRLDKIVINKRTKAHVACYPGNGTRYIKHVDNPNGDGRVITAIYYLNKDWNTERDGGLLRMFPAGMDRVANIEPLFDRALFFWSDRRNPHEVLPAYRDRFAITVWYIGESRI